MRWAGHASPAAALRYQHATPLTDHLARFVAPETGALVLTGEKGGPLRPQVLATAWNATASEGWAHRSPLARSPAFRAHVVCRYGRDGCRADESGGPRFTGRGTSLPARHRGPRSDTRRRALGAREACSGGPDSSARVLARRVRARSAHDSERAAKASNKKVALTSTGEESGRPGSNRHDQLGRLARAYGDELRRTEIAGQRGYVVGSEYARTAAAAGYPRAEIDPVRLACQRELYHPAWAIRRGHGLLNWTNGWTTRWPRRRFQSSTRANPHREVPARGDQQDRRGRWYHPIGRPFLTRRQCS